MNKTIAFIPAKTGSIGLPGKLFKKIGDYNLLEWTLLAANNSSYISEIIVSSNDPEIRCITQDFQKNKAIKPCLFIQRPDFLCTPTSKTEAAISHFFMSETRYTSFDYLVMLQATSPARRHHLIDDCISSMIRSNYDSLITVEAITPFFWRQNDEIGTAYPTYSLEKRPMRQELQNSDYYYKDNGNIYITKVERFLESKLRISGKTFLYPTSKFESMQIDDIEDFVMMESLYKYYGNFL